MAKITKGQFQTMLIFLIPQVVKIIAEKYKKDQKTATRLFYNSELYKMLEKESTKIWHFSPLTLFTMFDEETKTGNFNIPEEC
ncbi:hypothetical protein FACS1894190_07420 [Spirochaetia bacterium]|nr:hypothetical protein FACS1894190_07420 [Spirochaetia bacterium]